MRSLLRHIFKNGSAQKALVLMYHRVAEPTADIWDITVSPLNFEQHLKVLQKDFHVVPLSELVERVKQKRINKNYIAITFDDGYEDNYLVAKPLLEKYKLPVTFFITSTNLDTENAFWWDELEQLIFNTKDLPPVLSITVNNETISLDLGKEAQLTETQEHINSSWKACDEAPPSLRCELFLRLWQSLKPLPHAEQQLALQKIKDWIASGTVTNKALKSMSSMQLQSMSSNSLFAIGAHTVSHPALACHSLEFQKQEMIRSKSDLEAITGKEVSLLAYPYGNYNSETLIAAADAKFDAAFTTEEKVITEKTDRYRLARYQVKNWTGDEFSSFLQNWLPHSK